MSGAAQPNRNAVRRHPPNAGPMVVTSVRLAAATTRNCRERNEDAIGINGWVLYGDPVDPMVVGMPVRWEAPVVVAVTDGIAGAPDGHRAARIAAEQLTGDRPKTIADPTGWVRATFGRAHSAVRAGSGDSGRGCTAAVVAVNAHGSAIVANVGDVRVYRVVDRYAGQVSEDHRMAGGNAVDRLLGGHEAASAEPYVYGFQVQAGDRLLLCSDGFHDAVSARRVEPILRQLNSRRVAIELVNLAINAGQGDNITVVIVDIEGQQLPPAHPTVIPAPVSSSGRPPNPQTHLEAHPRNEQRPNWRFWAKR